MQSDALVAALSHPSRLKGDVERDPLDQPQELLGLLNLKSAMQVADILGANGYYAEILSRIVGPMGTVHFINNAAYDQWSRGVEHRFAQNRLPNVHRRTVNLHDMALTADRLDAVIMIKVFHDLYMKADGWPPIEPHRVLQQIADSLRAGGRLLVVDHSTQGADPHSPSALHRIFEPLVQQAIERTGLTLTSSSQCLRTPSDDRSISSLEPSMRGKTDRFVLVFTKPAA